MLSGKKSWKRLKILIFRRVTVLSRDVQAIDYVLFFASFSTIFHPICSLISYSYGKRNKAFFCFCNLETIHYSFLSPRKAEEMAQIAKTTKFIICTTVGVKDCLKFPALFFENYSQNNLFVGNIYTHLISIYQSHSLRQILVIIQK